MARSTLLTITLQSHCLSGETDVNVIYPLQYCRSGGKIKTEPFSQKKLKVLWLIHGGTDDYSSWITNTMLPVYAEKYDNLLIVMPTVYDFHRMRKTEDYDGYVYGELPSFIREQFSVSERREDNFIAGLSMGGYFSYKLAMLHPERYSALGSFSSPLDIEEDMRARHRGETDYPSPGEVHGNPERDLFSMIEKNIRDGAEMPAIFQTCGTEDMTYELNRKMKAFLEERGFAHHYEEWPGGHTWEFWNASIEKFLRWLPL